MKLWIDDLREAPRGYMWLKSVKEAKAIIEIFESDKNLAEALGEPFNHKIEVISLDHDAGDYARWGGDYIRLLDWLEETGRSYPIHIHSQNPVGVENMRRIIKRNGWREVR